MRISRFILISLIAILAISALVSCDASLSLEARTVLTVRNYSTDPITEVNVRWPGLAEEGFVLKHRTGETVSLQAAPDDESPVEVMLQDLNYFPRSSGLDPEYTATFQGGRTETIVTGSHLIEFAKPVAEVFTSSVRITNGLSNSITGVVFRRDQQPSDPATGSEFAYTIGLGLPFTGIESGASWTVNMNSTDESKVRGTFHVYVAQQNQDGYYYAGTVSTSVAQTSSLNVD